MTEKPAWCSLFDQFKWGPNTESDPMIWIEPAKKDSHHQSKWCIRKHWWWKTGHNCALWNQHIHWSCLDWVQQWWGLYKVLLCWATRLHFCQWKKPLKSQHRTLGGVLSTTAQQWQNYCWNLNNFLTQASFGRSCPETGPENWLGVLPARKVPKPRKKHTAEDGTRAAWETKGAWLKGTRAETENWVWEEKLWKQGQRAKLRLSGLNSKSAKWAGQ